MEGSHVLAEGPSGMRNPLMVDIEGRFAAVIGAVVRRSIRKAVGEENRGLKAAAESSPADAPAAPGA
jgi:hypothetical protein